MPFLELLICPMLDLNKGFLKLKQRKTLPSPLSWGNPSSLTRVDLLLLLSPLFCSFTANLDQCTRGNQDIMYVDFVYRTLFIGA